MAASLFWIDYRYEVTFHAHPKPNVVREVAEIEKISVERVTA